MNVMSCYGLNIFTKWTKDVQLNSYSNAKRFSSLSCKRITVFEVMKVYPIDRYQNAIPKAMPLHDLKKKSSIARAQFILMTHDSTGHLKTLWMTILSLIGGIIESEWKRHSSKKQTNKNKQTNKTKQNKTKQNKNKTKTR